MDPNDPNGQPSHEDDPNTHELGPTEAPEGEDPLPGMEAINDDDGNEEEPEGEGDDQYFEDGTDVLYLPADHVSPN